MFRMIRPFPALLVALLVASACGGSDTADQAATGATAPVATTATPVADTEAEADITVPSTDAAPPASAAPTSAPPTVEVVADVAYTSEQQLDVYVPPEGQDWPVVVYFHGGNPTHDPDLRKIERPTAEAIAEQGVLVYVPTWNGMGPAGGSEESICAIAFAHATAGDYGGDPERVMPAGYSAGGYSAVIHALIGHDPPLPVTDCVVDTTIPMPTAFAGGGSSLFVAEWGRQGLFPFPSGRR
jgi:acetyl esterase/lipase